MILCGVLSCLMGLGLLCRKRLPKAAAKALLIVFIMGILGIAAGIREWRGQVFTDGSKIRRNPAGEGDYQEELQLKAEGILEKYDYMVDVPEQKLTTDEEKAYLKAAEEEIAKEFPGRNESVNCIRTQTIIRSSYQEGKVAAEWLFGDYGVIDTAGKIVAEELPKEGVLVEATVSLICGSSECEYSFAFRVYPRLLDEQETFINNIKTALREEGEKRGEEYFSLPKKIGNYAVTWTKKKEHLPEKILLFGIVLAGLTVALEQSRKVEKQKARERQLQMEYPDMVSKLALLLGAGMTLGGAWKRIVSSYQKKQKNGKICFVYEEMLLTIREMESGVGEGRAYIRFGERCGIQTYRRFSGMLVRNLNKGNREMMEMLLQESENAFEERKSLAKKYGEEAGTKLLMPMILLLCVIMVILLVPAVLSFQI